MVKLSERSTMTRSVLTLVFCLGVLNGGAEAFNRRSIFDLSTTPDRLDIASPFDTFDPFESMDTVFDRNSMWNWPRPFYASDSLRKYRVTLNCAGFSPESIRVDIKDNKLIIFGSEGERHDTDDYSFREFRKTYRLPENVEKEKMTSRMSFGGRLTVEIPYKPDEKGLEKTRAFDQAPRIVDTENGGKAVVVSFLLPKNLDRSKVSVTHKDRDLVVEAQDKNETNNAFSNIYFYKRTSLPGNTNFDQLQAKFENNQLVVSAPLLPKSSEAKQIPIEMKKGEDDGVTISTVDENQHRNA